MVYMYLFRMIARYAPPISYNFINLIQLKSETIFEKVYFIPPFAHFLVLEVLRSHAITWFLFGYFHCFCRKWVESTTLSQSLDNDSMKSILSLWLSTHCWLQAISLIAYLITLVAGKDLDFKQRPRTWTALILQG